MPGRAGQGLTAEWGEAAGETPHGRLLGLGVHGGGLCAVSEGFPEEVPLRRVLEVGLDGWPRILEEESLKTMDHGIQLTRFRNKEAG